MGFANTREYVDAITNGQTHFSAWRKVMTEDRTPIVWFDLSIAPGSPSANSWITNIARAATVLDGTTGLPHGGDVAPLSKYLARFTLICIDTANVPMVCMLCDYVLYYPSVRMDTVALQLMDNTTPLPRYTDGEGLRILAIQTSQCVGGEMFTIGYTNSSGVAGRFTIPQSISTVPLIGTLAQSSSLGNAPSANGPFIPLQDDDTGVRSIDSIEFDGVDVGSLVLVLARPLDTFMVRGIDAPAEIDLLQHRATLPVIMDGAYLSLLMLPAGGDATTANFAGSLTTVWG